MTLQHVRCLPTFLSFVALLSLVACGGGGNSSDASTALPPQQIVANASSIANGSVDVDLKTTVQITFDAAPSTDGLADAVSLSGNGTPTAVALSVSGNVLTIAPTAPLHPRTSYTLTVKAGTKAVNGTTLRADFRLAFKTIAALFEYARLAPPDSKFLSIGPTLMAATDLNGDARPDVVQLTGLPSALATGFNPGYSLSIYLQNAAGGLDKVQEIDYVIDPSTVYDRTYSKVVLLDIDGDGRPEIVVPEYKVGDAVESGLRIFKAGSDGQFVATGFVPSVNVKQIEVLDVDGDGRKDLVGTSLNNYGGAMQVFWNRGTGLVASPEVILESGQYDLGVTDLDHDGRPELVLGLTSFTIAPPNPATRFMAFSRSGDAVVLDGSLSGFVSGVCAALHQCTSMSFIDVTGDGWDDLVFGEGAFYRRTPNGGFSLEWQIPFGAGGPVLTVADMDGDGLKDLAIVDFAEIGGSLNNFTAVAFARRSLTFEYSSAFILPTFDTPTSTGAVVVVDFDGNGLPDILTSTGNDGISLMRQVGS